MRALRIATWSFSADRQSERRSVIISIQKGGEYPDRFKKEHSITPLFQSLLFRKFKRTTSLQNTLEGRAERRPAFTNGLNAIVFNIEMSQRQFGDVAMALNFKYQPRRAFLKAHDLKSV